MFRQLLVPLDGSAVAESILPAVEAFARVTGAGVRLVRAVEPAEPTAAIIEPDAAVSERDQRAAEAAHAYLVGIAQRLSHLGLPVTTRVLIGHPAEAIIRLGGEVDLIAMGTHGRSGIGRWVYGSVADKVLHGATVPVLLIRARADGAAGGAAPRRILVPLDGSELAEQALPPATEIARRAGGTIVLMQSVAWAVMAAGDYPYGYGAGIDVASLLEQAEDQARDYLDQIAQRLHAEGIGTQAVVRADPAAGAILSVADDQQADLIVMSTHGRSGLGRWVLGSVADRVLRASARPVLLIRSGVVGGISPAEAGAPATA